MGDPPLTPGFVYLVDVQASLDARQKPKSVEWAESWTVSGSFQDELAAFNGGKREVLGVANLSTVLTILSNAENQGDLGRTDRVTFAFRLEK
jgi:hypothetical protein